MWDQQKSTIRCTAMSTKSGQVSALLVDLQNGDHAAASRLLPIVYNELRRLAVCLAKTLRVRRINDLGAHLPGILFAMIL
jgi:hypothetical protein